VLPLILLLLDVACKVPFHLFDKPNERALGLLSDLALEQDKVVDPLGLGGELLEKPVLTLLAVVALLVDLSRNFLDHIREVFCYSEF